MNTLWIVGKLPRERGPRILVLRRDRGLVRGEDGGGGQDARHRRGRLDVLIRAAVLGDARSIAALSGELGYPDTPSEFRSRLRALFRKRDQRVLVAEFAGGDVCGWIQAHASMVLEGGFRAEIVGLVVSSKVRRAGVGRKLVAGVEAWAAGLPVPKLVVRSNVTRKESHRFYPALGFERTKTQAVYAKRLRD